MQENNVRQNLNELENEKFIYDLWIEGKESGKWESIRDMAKVINIDDSNLAQILQGHKERLEMRDIPQSDKLTYDDFARSRLLEDYPETRKKVLEKRANREIKSQSELHDISKKLAEFPDEEQQLEILDDIEEQEEFNREAFDTIIEKKKEIAITQILGLKGSAWKCIFCNKWIKIDLRKKGFKHLRQLPEFEK